MVVSLYLLLQMLATAYLTATIVGTAEHVTRIRVDAIAPMDIREKYVRLNRLGNPTRLLSGTGSPSFFWSLSLLCWSFVLHVGAKIGRSR